MATRTRRTSTTKPKLASVPAPEVEELDFDLDELELDEAPAETPKPTPRAKAKATPKPVPVVEEDEEEEELTFEEEEAPAPTPKVEKAKAAPKPKTTRQAVEDAGASGQFLSGYVKGHFGIDLSPDEAQEIRETLSVAGVDYEHPLLERLLGASSAQLVPTPALKRTVSRPAVAKAAPKAAVAKPKKAAVSDDGLNLAEVRAWAQANGYEVGDRGRIKQEIKDAFVEANG
jgi:hypothetical protein